KAAKNCCEEQPPGRLLRVNQPHPFFRHRSVTSRHLPLIFPFRGVFFQPQFPRMNEKAQVEGEASQANGGREYPGGLKCFSGSLWEYSGAGKTFSGSEGEYSGGLKCLSGGLW